jgi:hypothetical protein
MGLDTVNNVFVKSFPIPGTVLPIQIGDQNPWTVKGRADICELFPSMVGIFNSVGRTAADKTELEARRTAVPASPVPYAQAIMDYRVSSSVRWLPGMPGIA